ATAWYAELALMLGTDANSAAGLSVLNLVANGPLATNVRSLILGNLGAGLRRRGMTVQRLLQSSEADPKLEQAVMSLLNNSLSLARDAERSVGERVSAVHMLVFFDSAPCRESLRELLNPQVDPNLQRAAANVLGQLEHTEVPKLLLAGWRSHSPALRRMVIEALLRSTDRAGVLLDALQEGTVLRGA